jgi:hypothetical protein
MAPIERCPWCKDELYASSEQARPGGTRVVYICRNNACRGFRQGKGHYRLEKFVRRAEPAPAGRSRSGRPATPRRERR